MVLKSFSARIQPTWCLSWHLGADGADSKGAAAGAAEDVVLVAELGGKVVPVSAGLGREQLVAILTREQREWCLS